MRAVLSLLQHGKIPRQPPEGAGIESQVPLNDRPHAVTEPNERCSSVCSVSDSIPRKFRGRETSAVRPRDGAATVQFHFFERPDVHLADVRFEAHYGLKRAIAKSW
jgi:hypothetical protein